MIGQSWFGGKLTLTQFREKNGLSQRDVAREVEVPHNTISRYESGETKSLRLTVRQFRNFERLCERYGLTLDDLELD